MAEVLSQSQIDALLKEMRSGGNGEKKQTSDKEEKKYRKYDFYSPKKITKDKIKLLKGIYDNYARIASSRLNGVIRVNSEIEVKVVEEQRFYEFSNALNENDIIMLQTLKLPNNSKNPPILVHINQLPMLAMIDRMLGGDGNDLDGIDENYSYTDIEIELYQKIMGYFLGFTKDAWSNYIAIESEKITLEANPGLFQEISLDETVAIIIMDMQIMNTKGRLTVCIPRTLLAEIFGIIDANKHKIDTEENETQDTREFILSQIKNSSLVIKASMGKFNVSVKDIKNLQVGDVINLQKPENSEVYLNIEGVPWLKGKMGSYKKDAAVLVSGRTDNKNDELILADKQVMS